MVSRPKNRGIVLGLTGLVLVVAAIFTYEIYQDIFTDAVEVHFSMIST